MGDIVKFQSLKLNEKYQVIKYSDSFKTKYGDSRILLVSKNGSDETFEVYATKLLLRYINEMKKKGERFNFTVMEKRGNKFPYIEGYSLERIWFELN